MRHNGDQLFFGHQWIIIQTIQPPMFKYSPHCMDTTMQNFRQAIKYTTTNYSRQPDHSKQVQKIPIKYIINITMLQRGTSHHSTEDYTSIWSWSTYENICRMEINVWKLLYNIERYKHLQSGWLKTTCILQYLQQHGSWRYQHYLWHYHDLVVTLNNKLIPRWKSY